MTSPSPLKVWNKEMTQGLPLLGKFGHPNAVIARVAARAEHSDDHLDTSCPFSDLCVSSYSLFHEPPPRCLSLFNLPLWRTESTNEESQKSGRKLEVSQRESLVYGLLSPPCKNGRTTLMPPVAAGKTQEKSQIQSHKLQVCHNQTFLCRVIYT